MTPEGSRRFSGNMMRKDSRMMPKSVQRFSGNIMRKERIRT